MPLGETIMPADILALFQEHGLTLQKKTAKEWASPCPCCGGTDRCSVWPEDQDGRGYYWCRQCNAKGDGIQFLRDYTGMSYADACKRVGVAPVANLKAPALRPMARTEKFQPVHGELGHLEGANVPVWRGRAAAFVSWATEHLLNSPEQLAWLAARGIDAAAAKRYRLGYNPGEKGKNCIIRPRPVWGLPPEKKEGGKEKFLWLPRGIVIPQVLVDDEKETVHRVRIRRLDADREIFRPKHKYHVVEGSGMDVLWLDCTTVMHEGGGIVVVVESELDAIMLHALVGDMAHCVASMTSNLRKLSASVFDRLGDALCILVALDMDKAGADGWTRWQETFPRAKRWPVPAGKDPGEAFALGENLRLWLLAGIPAGLRLIMQQSPSTEQTQTAPTPQSEQTSVPFEVLQAYAMWQKIPLTHTRFEDEHGNCIGWSWDFDQIWEPQHRQEAHTILRYMDKTAAVWDWLSRNPSTTITAENFLSFQE